MLKFIVRTSRVRVTGSFGNARDVLAFVLKKIRGKNKRLSVIFITETGSREEPLLGMLTPYDVMQDD